MSRRAAEFLQVVDEFLGNALDELARAAARGLRTGMEALPGLDKRQGGAAAVAAAKSALHEEEVAAGSVRIENMGADLQPIRTDSNARNAYDDGRMLKLQVASAVGIPEQYFGDISIGNLATAKTVELPMMKMFQSYQAIWADTYKDINEIILEHSGIPNENWHVDMDFPSIAPEDVAQMAQSLSLILQNLPQFADSPDVQQVALMALGINNTQEVIDALTKEAKKNGHTGQLIKALREYKVNLEGLNAVS